MSDEELTALAAKAFGNAQHGFSPLSDDGDALRLAVKLHIGIRSHGPTHWQQPNTSVALYEIGEDVGGRIQVRHGDDPSHATRRAIVKAAAAIGRAMP